MKCMRFVRCLAALAVATAILTVVAAAKDIKPNTAVVPAPRSDAGWQAAARKHERSGRNRATSI